MSAPFIDVEPNHFDVFLFEDSPAGSNTAEKAYLDEVRNCDIYLGLIGSTYGYENKEGISPTEQEYNTAKDSNKTIVAYIRGNNDIDREDKVRSFIYKINHPQDGVCYKRFNNESELLSEVYASLIVFLKEHGVIDSNNFDEKICPNTDINNLDEEKIKWFIRTSNERRNSGLDSTLNSVDILTKLGLIENNHLKNSAILLFGNNVQQHFRQAQIKCVHYQKIMPEKPPLSFHIYEGNLFDQIDKAVAFVMDSIKSQIIQQEHTAQMKRIPEIPVFAVQEAIVNAVAHRDYNTTSSVQVMIFSDRIEILNSGSLPPQLNIDDLDKVHSSYPHNILLADILYRADYIQTLGSGTMEMIKQCKKAGLPKPKFENIRGMEFKTVLYRDKYTDEYLKKLGLNERQLKAVEYIKDNGEINRKTYSALVSISPRQSLDDLTYMVENELLEIIGKGRSTRYILK